MRRRTKQPTDWDGKYPPLDLSPRELPPRLPLVLAGLAYLGVAVRVVMQMMNRSVWAGFEVMVLVSPLMLILLLVQRRHWVGLTLGLLVLQTRIPFALVDKLSLAQLFIVGQCGLVLFYKLKQREKFLALPDVGARIMLVLAIFVTLRVAYDRPGSARIGATGGAAMAMQHLVGVWGYFVLRRVAAQKTDWTRQLRIAVAVAGLALIAAVVRSLFSADGFYWGLLYHRQMWLLAALALAVVASSPALARTGLPWYPLTSGVLFVLAAFTPHRSRPLFAVVNALAIAHVYHRFRRVLVFLLVLCILSIGLVVRTDVSLLPGNVYRSLSIFGDTGFVNESMRNEWGWSSNFRRELTREALGEIARRPLVGRGFSFDAELLTKAMRYDRDPEMRRHLTLSGTYHNELPTIAVFCGLPFAIAFVAVWLLVTVRLLRWACRSPAGPKKAMAAALLGFLAASTGQFLMNGGGGDFLNVCVILGIASGMMSPRAPPEDARAAPVGASRVGEAGGEA